MPKRVDVEAYSDALSDWAHLNPLRRFRRKNKLNLRKMGLMLGVAEGTLRSWEIGSMRPSPANMGVVKRITGVTEDDWAKWAAGVPIPEEYTAKG